MTFKERPALYHEENLNPDQIEGYSRLLILNKYDLKEGAFVDRVPLRNTLLATLHPELGNFLSKDYIVKASVGHIRDLPPHEMGVDVDNDFRPPPLPTP